MELSWGYCSLQFAWLNVFDLRLMVLYIGVVPSPHVRILYKVLPEASMKPSHCEFVPRLALILSQSSGQACLRVCRVEESDQVKLWPTASAMALQPSWQPLRIVDAQHNMQLSLQQTQLPIRWAANPSPLQPSQLNALPEQPWPLFRSTSQGNGTSLPPGSFATKLKKSQENVSPLCMEGQGRLPKYVSGLLLQQLPCGSFSVLDLTWRRITERRATSLVAAIPKARLDDFVAGEEKRGNSTVNMWVARQESAGTGVLMNKRAECFYAAPKHAQQKDRKLQLPSDKPLPMVPGKVARRGSIQKGTSAKRDCRYQFFAKEYSKRAEVPFCNEPVRAFFPGTVGNGFSEGSCSFRSFCCACLGRHRSTQPSCSSAHLHFPASRPTCSQCSCRTLLLLRQSRPALP
jgi:hypothetical protein